jgi:hypothetical protein
MPKANEGSIPNLEGDKVGEILPNISNIPPKIHPRRALKLLFF